MKTWGPLVRAVAPVAGWALMAVGLLGVGPVRAQPVYGLTIDSVEVENASSPAVPRLTSGYLAKVNVKVSWAGMFAERAQVTILLNQTPVLEEVHAFRDGMGTYRMAFSKMVRLPAQLPAGSHRLTVSLREPPGANHRIESQPRMVNVVLAAPAQAAGVVSPPPPAPAADRATVGTAFANALVRRIDQRYGTRIGAVAPTVNATRTRTDLRGSYREGLDEHGSPSGRGPSMRASVSLRMDENAQPGFRSTHAQYTSLDQVTTTAWMRSAQPFYAAGISPGYLVGSIRVHGIQTSRGTNHVGVTYFVDADVTVMWAWNDATRDVVIVSFRRHLPVAELPVEQAGPALEQLKAEVAAIAGDMVAAAHESGFVAASLRGEWASPPATAASTPNVTPPPPPVAPPSPAGLVGARSGRAPARESTWAERVAEIGETSAARAAAATAATVPSAEGLSAVEVAVLAEAALTDRDPAEVMAELAEEEQAALTTGSGDGLRVERVEAAPERPAPGELVTVTMTVRNTARDGGPAIYDVGLCDYHDNNRDVARLRRRALAPGATARHTLTFAAPRAYNFGGYAYIEPRAFAGDTLPQEVLNLRIAWDGSTMTDEEIIAELHDRNPCPDDYPLTGDRLTRWVAFYRAQGHATFAALQNEAIAAQRERMQADLEARLNDPARLDQLQADLDAAANTKLLAAYESLRRLAREWGRIHGLDLVAMVDDAVYVDAQSRVVGDVGAARAQVLAAIEAKQRGGAVQSLLLGTGSGQTSALHRRIDPLVNQALLAANVGNIENVATKNLVDFWMKRAVEAHRQLQRVARDAHTSVRAWEASRNNLREVIAEANRQLGGVNNDFFKTTLAKAGEQLRELDRVAAQAEVFRREGRRALGTKKWAERFGKAVEKVGDLWALYDTGEKVAARVSAGEDFAVALGKETGAWAVKKVITACPVIGAADAVMGGTAALLKYLGPEYWEQEGVDPAQYTASGVLDIGIGVSFAAVEDLGTKTAERLEKLPPLEPTERARLERQIEAFEARLEATTDPEVRQRMLTVRAYARQTLRERS